MKNHVNREASNEAEMRADIGAFLEFDKRFDPEDAGHLSGEDRKRHLAEIREEIDRLKK